MLECLLLSGDLDRDWVLHIGSDLLDVHLHGGVSVESNTMIANDIFNIFINVHPHKGIYGIRRNKNTSSVLGILDGQCFWFKKKIVKLDLNRFSHISGTSV